MLKVTDDGVKIALEPQLKTPFPLRELLVLAVLFFINTILCVELHLYSREMMAILNVVILMISFVIQQWRRKHQPKILSGGDLLLTSKQFVHNLFGTTTQYQLQATDNVNLMGDVLTISNQQGKVLYQIQGFSEPKQLEVAQAVLSGKTIATQTKAIKMQSR